MGFIALIIMTSLCFLVCRNELARPCFASYSCEEENSCTLPVCSSRPCFMLGCHDIRRIRFCSGESLCPCEMDNIANLLAEGFETWRSDPVLTSAHFAVTCTCNTCFAGKPLFFKDKTECGSRVYVLLGASYAGEIAFELVCHDAGCGREFYTVCGYSFIC